MLYLTGKRDGGSSLARVRSSYASHLIELASNSQKQRAAAHQKSAGALTGEGFREIEKKRLPSGGRTRRTVRLGCVSATDYSASFIHFLISGEISSMKIAMPVAVYATFR